MTDLLQRLQEALADRYTVMGELGSGGMATVYLAQDRKHNRQVAVKVLRPDLAVALGTERFLREIEIAAGLHHPHILPLYDSGEADGLLFYVMPRVEGESLRDRLNKEKQLPVAEAVQITREVADALSYAHSRDVIHRDIKPENIMLESGHAVVADFGIARAISAAHGTGLTQTGLAMGTPAYMSPEQAGGHDNLDGRTDIYSLACVLYEMLGGQPPFMGTTVESLVRQVLAVEPPPITNLRPSVPPSIVATLESALAKAPADRMPTAAAFAEALTWPTTSVQLAIRRSEPARVTGLFLLASAAILGVVYFLMIQLGLPDWVLTGAFALLGIGVPIIMVTGWAERRRARARARGAVTQEARPPPRAWRWLTWQRALTGGGAAFAALGVFSAVYMVMRALGIGPVGTLTATGALDERGRLIVAEFENRTSDSTLGPTVTEALRIDLAQSSAVTLVTPVAIADALARMGADPGTTLDLGVALDVAQRDGIKAVVTGEISAVGQGYLLAARIVSARDGQELAALRASAKDDGQLIDAIDGLSSKLRERIGESLRSVRAAQPLADVSTGSLEALRRYSQAIRGWTAGDVEQPIALLEEAIALDSTFAMAYRKLAAILYDYDVSPSRMIEASTKAYLLRERLPEPERYMATAWYYDLVEVDRQKVIAAYRSLIEWEPDNVIAMANLADAHMAMRQWKEAADASLRAVEQSDLPLAYFNAIEAHVALGKLEEARALHRRLAEVEPSHPDVLWLAALLAGVERDYELADGAVDSLGRAQRASLSWQRIVVELEFGYAVVRGRLDRARSAAARLGMIFDQSDQRSQQIVTAIELAEVELVAGARERATALVDRALADHPLDRLAPLDRPYLRLAEWYARSGHIARAKRLLEEFHSQVPESLRRDRPLRHGAQAAVALAEGRWQDAVDGYRAWYAGARCAVCGLHDLGRAHELAGDTVTAIATYERAIETPGLYRGYEERFTLPRTLRRLAELYESRDREKSRDFYARLAALWEGADAELQASVRDATDRSRRRTAS